MQTCVLKLSVSGSRLCPFSSEKKVSRYGFAESTRYRKTQNRIQYVEKTISSAHTFKKKPICLRHRVISLGNPRRETRLPIAWMNDVRWSFLFFFFCWTAFFWLQTWFTVWDAKTIWRADVTQFYVWTSYVRLTPALNLESNYF